MIQVTPDHEGYRDAQERIRALLGESIILLQPITRTYDPSVALDPESGEPFDPQIQPTTSGQVAIEAHGRIAFRGIPHRDDSAPVVGGALGLMENSDVVAIFGSGVASAGSAAVGMMVRGERYEVRAARTDGIAGVDRYLVYGSKVTA